MNVTNFLLKLIKPSTYHKLQSIEKLIIARGNTGGLAKRIDENRELYQLLQKEAPQFLQKHFYVKGWIAGNDNFFTELSVILDLAHNPKHHVIFERSKKISDMN